MIKKVMAGITAAMMLCVTPGFAAPGGGIDFTITQNGSFITVEGTLPERNVQYVTVRAYETGSGNETNAKKIAAYLEEKSNTDGSFKFTFEMNDAKFGAEKTSFTVDVASKGIEPSTKTYDYMNKGARDDVIEQVKKLNKDTFPAYFNNTENRDEFAAAGIDMDAYGKMTDDDKAKAVSLFSKECDFKSLDENAFAKRMNAALGITELSDPKCDADKVLRKINPIYSGDIAYLTMVQNNDPALGDILKKIKDKYSSISEFEFRFREIYGLYAINHAKSGTIEDALGAAADILGYESDEAYQKYTQLKNKSTANDNLVVRLKNTPADKVSDLMNQIERSMQTETNGGSGGSTGKPGRPSGGGGGGSFGGGSRYDVDKDLYEGKDEGTLSKTDFYDTVSVPWAEESIKLLSMRGVLNGYPDGTFKPNNAVTRAEFAKIVITGMGVPAGGTECKFKDVPNGYWGASYIAAANEIGIIMGVDEDNFLPDEMITRQDMAVILARALEYKNCSIESGSGVNFSDAEEISDYAKINVMNLAAAGLLTGDENANFNPHDNLTRAEAAVACGRIFKVMDEKGDK